MKDLLDLDALREARLPRPPDPQPSVARLVESDRGLPLSRREWLGVTGAAAASFPPLGRAALAAARGPVQIISDRDRVAFRLGGKEYWVIDRRRFGGSPRLHCRRDGGVTRVELQGATYPGTELPADLVCEVRSAAVGSRMRLQMALGGFEAEAPLELWLCGHAAADAPVRLEQTVCRLGRHALVQMHGAAEGRFSPTWMLELNGRSIARMSGGDGAIASDSVTIALLDGDTPSLLTRPAEKRTLVSLARGANPWSPDGALPEALAAPDGAKLTAPESPFDLVRIEAGQNGAGTARYALAAECSDEEPRLAFRPGGDLTDSDGRPFELPLRRPRYAAALDGAGTQTALVADFGREPVWMHGDGLSLQLGEAPDGPPFEITHRSEGLAGFRCEPAALAMSAPLPGAIVDARPIGDDVRISFTAAGTEVAQVRRIPPVRVPARPPKDEPTPKPEPRVERRPPGPEIRIDPGRVIGRVPLQLFIIDVVRPDDFLALQFQFPNLTLRTETGQPARLVRTKREEAAHIVVHFPPQNIGEQAFLESAQELVAGAGGGGPLRGLARLRPRAAPRAAAIARPLLRAQLDNPSRDEGLQPPPVKSRLADRSRLAFRLPNDMTEVPYTLEALLDWARYEPSLAPTAVPPPPPPRRLQVIRPDGTILINPGVVRPGAVREAPSRIVPGRVEREAPPLRRVPPGAGPRIRREQYRPTDGPPLRVAQGPLRRRAPTTPSRRIVAPPTRPAVAPSAGGLIVRPEILRPVAIIPDPAAPKVSQTAIETPYRLILSPNKLGAWLHSTGPVSHDGRTELWHTRLGVESADGRVFESRYEYSPEYDGTPHVIAVHASGDSFDHYRTLRAIWTPDYAETLPTVPDPPPPFRMSLHYRDRAELVWLTANFRLQDTVSRVIKANRLMLSSLGAWMDTRYAADIILTDDKNPGLSIEEWVHQATMGRDHYVRVVKKGYLFPFGHRASLVRVTERKFEQMGGGRVAYLRQRYFVVVREPEKVYPATGQPLDARMMPLRRLRITTLVTPTLNAPGDSKIPGLPASAEAGFWPRIGTQDFAFHFVGEDWDEQRCEFTSPAAFVGVENVQGSTTDFVAFNTGAVETIVADYEDPAKESRRKREMYGQKVAFAQSSPTKPGDTTLEAESITFGAGLPTVSDDALKEANEPRFYPTVDRAQVCIPAAPQMAAAQGAASIAIDEAYINNGWSATGNKGEVFIKLLAAQALEFGADKSGGVATPNLSVEGLSRRFGPVGGNIAQLAEGTFDPKDFFSGAAAKILGGIDLADIIPSGFGDGTNVPKLTATPVYPDNNNLAPPEAIDTKLEWQPEVIEFGPFKPKTGAEFKLNALLHTELAGGDSTYKVDGLLTKFAIDLFGFIVLDFASFTFAAASGKKMDVKPDITDVSFGGPLEFINELKDFLNFGGDDGGLSLDITPTKVTAGFTLPIPTVAVGVLTIQNISVGAALEIPFLGDPVRLRFNFCERDNPFILTVSMFGGGGFAAVSLGLDGVELLEVSLEFGGAIAFDIGVASGGVEIMAGIYFKWEDDESGGGATLTGYLRLGGSLEILGIITISCEFYMGLTYASAGNKVWGEAKLTVKIEILFFSVSVSLKCRREFADPDRATFKSLMPTQQIWAEYCEAFA